MLIDMKEERGEREGWREEGESKRGGERERRIEGEREGGRERGEGERGREGAPLYK